MIAESGYLQHNAFYYMLLWLAAAAVLCKIVVGPGGLGTGAAHAWNQAQTEVGSAESTGTR